MKNSKGRCKCDQRKKILLNLLNHLNEGQVNTGHENKSIMRNAEQNLDLNEARDEKCNKPNVQGKDSPSEWIIRRRECQKLRTM